MRIGIDLDDTITELPWLFEILTRGLKEAGHEIHIITYRDEGSSQEVAKELTAYKITYDKIHLPAANRLPAEWKAEVAKALQLDLMFDDSPEVLAGMPATTKRVWLCDPEIFDLRVCIAAMKAHAKLPVIH